MLCSRSPKKGDLTILLPSFRRYWTLLVATLSFSLLAAVFEGFSLGLLIPFLQNLSNDSAAFVTGVDWIDTYVLAVNGSTLRRTYHICAVMLVATWLRTAFNYASSVFAIRGRASVVEDLRMRIIDQLQSVSLRYFARVRAGAVINTLTTELLRTSHALNIFIGVVSQVMLMSVYITVLIMVSWELSLLVLGCFALLSAGLTLMMRRIRTSGAKETTAASEFTSMITEFISGIRTVTAFNRQPYERDRLFDATNTFKQAVIETGSRGLFVKPFSQAIVGTLLVVTIVLAVQFCVLPGRIDLALLLAFLLALFRLMPIVHQLNGSRGDWASIRAVLSSVAQMLRTKDKPYLEEGTRVAPPLSSTVVFENVSFAYEEDRPVLNDINIEIKRGQTTAIVGSSGSGKSTLVDLIPRFYDPVEGRVLWDGTDLRKYTTRSLRERISIVSQSTFIFNESVADNIAYGALNANMDDIREAAHHANALEFIEEMDEGFDTILGDRGVRLSGGQRQRIAIARAILRDPEFLILDEATSSLDSVSERLVQKSLEQLMASCTVVAVAHRLSTIENADWVVVLEEGRVVEQGTYADLLRRRGHLWNYHSLQFETA
jgi:subfamily B ATP-binding cassette protein MsbA